MEVMQVEQTDDKYEPSFELDQISFTVTYTTQCRNRQHNRNSGASADKAEGENWKHTWGKSLYKFEEECENSKADKYCLTDEEQDGSSCLTDEEQDGSSCLTDEELSEDTERTLESDENLANYCPNVVPTSKRTDRGHSRRKCKKIKKSDQNIKQLEKVLKETRKENKVILNLMMSLLQILTTIRLTSEQSSIAISNLIKTEQHFEVNKSYSNVKSSGNSRKHSSKQNKKTTSKDLDIFNISNSLGFQLVVPTCLNISSNIARCLLNIHRLVYPMDMFIQSRDSLRGLEYVRFVRYGHAVECEFEKYKHRKIDTYPSNVSFRKNLCKLEFSPHNEVMASIQMNRVKVTLLSAVCSLHLSSKLFFQQKDVHPLLPFYNRRWARPPKMDKFEQYYEVIINIQMQSKIPEINISKQNMKITSKDLGIINTANSKGFRLVVFIRSEGFSVLAKCLMNVHRLVYHMKMFVQSRNFLHGLECVRFAQCDRDVECKHYQNQKNDTYYSNVSFKKNLWKSELCQQHEVMASIQTHRAKSILLSAVCSLHLSSKLFFQQKDVHPLLPFYNRLWARPPKMDKFEKYYEVIINIQMQSKIHEINISKQNMKITSKDLGIINTANSKGFRLVVSICLEGFLVLAKCLMNVHRLVYHMKMFVQSRNFLHGIECVRFAQCDRDVECKHYQNQKNDTYYSNVSFKKNLWKSELCQQHEVMASIQTHILVSAICSLHLKSNVISQQNSVRLLMPFYNPLGCYNPAAKMSELVVPPKTNSPKNNTPSTGKNEKGTNDSKENKKTSGRRLLSQDTLSIERREKSEYFLPNMFFMRQPVTSLNSNELSVFEADPGATDNSVQRCANQFWDYNSPSVEESCKSGSSERGILYTGIEERSEVCDIHEFDRHERVDGTNSHCQDRILNIHPTDDNNERHEMCTSVTKYLMNRNCVPFVDAPRTPLEGGTYGNITLRNTCCIDGFLLLVFNVLNADIDLRNQFTNLSNKVPKLHRMFYGIWEHFHDYNFNIAKVVWCDYGGLLSINDATASAPVTVDVTGSENDRIFCVLGKERLDVEHGCTNTVCPNATVASTDLYRVLTIFEKEGESLCDTIMKKVRNYLQSDISPCQIRQSNENHCSGRITQTIVDPPLIVPVNFYFLKFGEKKYSSTDIPDTVECNEQSYELRMVRFYKDTVSHFVDKIKIRNMWTYYDNSIEQICYFDEDPNGVQLSSCYYILVKSHTSQ